MTNSPIETVALTKRYGRTLAVDNLSLTVRAGEVYGFLGPNGAGKTTTPRMLLGLIRPTSGSLRLFGNAPGAASYLDGVGALIEGPAFYPYLSGRDRSPRHCWTGWPNCRRCCPARTLAR
jgi:ABC-2 type transport system ATP-binding protein